MKPRETTAIYVEACRSRRIAPQEEEGRLWHKTLALYETKDVKAALEAWWADTTVGKDGEPRGKWLPAPAELKPLIENVVHQRNRASINWLRRLGCAIASEVQTVNGEPFVRFSRCA